MVAHTPRGWRTLANRIADAPTLPLSTEARLLCADLGITTDQIRACLRAAHPVTSWHSGRAVYEAAGIVVTLTVAPAAVASVVRC